MDRGPGARREAPRPRLRPDHGGGRGRGRTARPRSGSRSPRSSWTSPRTRRDPRLGSSTTAGEPAATRPTCSTAIISSRASRPSSPRRHIAASRRPGPRPRRPGGVPVLSHPGAYFQRTTPEDARRAQGPRAGRPGGLHVLPHGRADRASTRELAARARPRGHGRLGFPRPDQAPRRLRRASRRATTGWSNG